jgi:hypothetical protein
MLFFFFKLFKAQADLELKILLPQPLEGYTYRCVLPPYTWL